MGRPKETGEAAASVATRVASFLRLEAALARVEMVGKRRSIVWGASFGAGALVAGAVVAGSAVAAATAAIALALPLWAALLLMAGGMTASAGALAVVVLVGLGTRVVPVPAAALEEARTTLDELAGRL